MRVQAHQARLIACFTLLQSFSLTSGAQASTLLQGYVQEQHAPVNQAVERPLTDSLPLSFQGTWSCTTTVTDSAIPQVVPGNVTECAVEFKPKDDGRIVALWNQPGWTESQASIQWFSKTEARVDRTNYYVGEGSKGSWAARSRDQFTQVSNDAIVAKSYVDQYVDGQFIGRYHTTSTLERIDDQTRTAMAR